MSKRDLYILIALVSTIVVSALFIVYHADFQDMDTTEEQDQVEAGQQSITEKDTTEQGPGTDKIFIKGSDTILPVSLSESEAFMKIHPDKEVVVIGGGSSLGISSFIEGEVEIAMASRKIKDKEREDASKKDIHPFETIIGWDGISVIINKDNPLETLSLTQLQKIYTGEITNWKEVGGEDAEIKVLVRDTSSGTYAFFRENVLDDKEYTSDAFTQPNTQAVVKEVSSNTAAIGYIGLAYLDESVKPIGLETPEGTFYPEPGLIRKGEYPLSRSLQYYTNGVPEGTAKEYIDFVLSEWGQEIIEDVGYLAIK